MNAKLKSVGSKTKNFVLGIMGLLLRLLVEPKAQWQDGMRSYPQRNAEGVFLLKIILPIIGIWWVCQGVGMMLFEDFDVQKWVLQGLMGCAIYSASYVSESRMLQWIGMRDRYGIVQDAEKKWRLIATYALVYIVVVDLAAALMGDQIVTKLLYLVVVYLLYHGVKELFVLDAAVEGEVILWSSVVVILTPTVIRDILEKIVLSA